MDRSEGDGSSRVVGPLVAAVEFFTRIPRPPGIAFHPEHARRSAGFAPLVGIFVGGLCAMVFALTTLVLPVPVSVVLTIAGGVWITGALHEDGFADVCDGFGAHVDRERTLAIMKDSRCGAFALVGVTLLIVVKISALVGIAEEERGRSGSPLRCSHLIA